MREFVKKGEKAPGAQIREALSRFDTNRDGTMSVYELRKAFQSMGLFAADDTIETFVKCYDKTGSGTADLVEFVEDIDPKAFSFAFSVGSVARAGTFDMVEKEMKIEPGMSDDKVIAMMRTTLKKRMAMDGTHSVLQEIKTYADGEGVMDQ